MSNLGLCLFAAGIVAIMIESAGIALLLFSAAIWVLCHA
jgi:hypothetical protein